MKSNLLLSCSVLLGLAACGFGNITRETSDGGGGGDAPADAAYPKLTVMRTGSGTVSSTPAGIDCGTDCSEAYAPGTTVELTATPDSSDITFVGWTGGGCSGTGPCSVTLDADTTVQAMFVMNNTVIVTLAGNGTGRVTSNPAGIDCGSTCMHTFSPGTMVTLTAAVIGDSTFTGWTGACTGTGACTVTVSAATAVTATFTLNQHAVTVTRAGSGSGTVTSSPAGINCGSTCSASFDSGTVVTLTAAASTGSTFTGWSGACTGTGACTVTTTAAQSVTATFTLNQYTLTVTKSGSGSGTVTSSPGGINCGTTCSSPYNYNTTVTLTPAAAVGSTFTGWSGACTGTGTCTVTMSADMSVTAMFTINSYALTVTKTGTGTGTVTSNPVGINCGTACSANYNYNTSVTLTATPSSGQTFGGWTGACTGTGTCTVTMTAAQSVSAKFNGSCTNTTVDIFGTDHVDFSYPDMMVWRGWNYFRAYNDSNLDLTGWVGFDLTSIPDTATIVSATFNAFANTVVASPSVRLQYSNGTNFWTNAGVQYSNVPRTNQQISAPFAPTNNAYNAWPLDVTVIPWTTELSDNWFVVGLDNVTTPIPSGTYAYFNATNASANRPYLHITYCN